MSTTVLRQPKGAKRAGVSAGGEFAPHAHTSPVIPDVPAHQLDRQFDTLDEKIAAMSSEVETLVKNLETDEGWQAYLSTMSKFHSYSLTNQLLIALQLPNATRVGGKTLWKSLGREVLPYAERGNGASIFRPRIVNVDLLDANGNVWFGPDGKPMKERRCVGFSSTTVYDVSQTSGADLPVGFRELSETPPDGFADDLRATIGELGYDIRFEDMHGTQKGYTTISGEKIVAIRTGLSDAEQVRVLAHELGHIAAGHVNKGEHYHTGEGGQRGRMEVEAESIGHVLLRMNGMDPSDTTGKYVAGWAGVQRDESTVADAATTVQKAVKELIGSRPWVNVPDSGPQEKPVYTRRRKKR